jgi:hypothetical protein
MLYTILSKNIFTTSGLSVFFFIIIISRYSPLECGDEYVEKQCIDKRLIVRIILKPIQHTSNNFQAHDD